MLKGLDFFVKLFLNVIGHPMSVAGSRAAPSAKVKEPDFQLYADGCLGD
jgi:hypothetical protein